MSILSTLTEKPWEHEPELKEQSKSREQVRRSGLKVLLMVVSALFFLFIIAFLMRSQYPDWQPLAEQPNQPLFNNTQLWFNTGYLILASVFLQLAKMNHQRFAQIGLVLGGLFSCAFVAGQLVFWQRLQIQGFVVNTNPAVSFFYLLTGLHAAHVIIGIIAWGVAVNVTMGPGAKRNAHKLNPYINLCATYWHYLLGLWVLLFALLTSKPETYNAIVEFCGLGV